MTRILIVDDSNAVCEQLRRVVERNPEWEVCGHAQNGREAVDCALKQIPDLILLDYRLPIINGLQAAREISRLLPNARLLLCSMHVSLDLSEAAREAGCHGAVSKYDSRQIIVAIAALLKQETFFTPETISSW
ncbi:MAG TPA: response regulator transcription factor [Candidatus Acidoferrales bacterium]|nr:response regulator transcription factor [Candidatus Acidoferrales bacterium]